MDDAADRRPSLTDTVSADLDGDGLPWFVSTWEELHETRRSQVSIQSPAGHTTENTSSAEFRPPRGAYAYIDNASKARANQRWGSRGDLDGDGYGDLVMPAGEGGGLWVARGGPEGLQFGATDLVQLAPREPGVNHILQGASVTNRADDVNADGLPDLSVARVVTDGSAPSCANLYLGREGGLLAARDTVLCAPGLDITGAELAGDVDGDGASELLVRMRADEFPGEAWSRDVLALYAGVPGAAGDGTTVVLDQDCPDLEAVGGVPEDTATDDTAAPGDTGDDTTRGGCGCGTSGGGVGVWGAVGAVLTLRRRRALST